MEIGRKYELTDETIYSLGTTLHRIRALRSFGNVKKGDLGGFIEKEENLSNEGTCWVYDDARVHNNAIVCDDARVGGHANVCDDARVRGHAFLYDNALVCSDAEICDSAQVHADGIVGGNAIVSENGRIFGNACVAGHSHIHEQASISGGAKIDGNSSICRDVTISNDVSLRDVNISCQKNYIAFNGFGSQHRDTAVVKNDDGSIRVFCGCFSGSFEEFENVVRERHGDTMYAKEYLSCINTAKIHFGIE